VLIQPLAQSRADQRRFIDRADETRSIVEAVRAAQPVLVLGERGSGRTSLLNHVAWLLAREEEPRDSVLISGEIASDPAQLLGVLVARVGRLAVPDGSRARWLEDLQALSMPDGPFGTVVQPAILMELIDLLGERLAELGRPVCVMIDGILPAVAHGVFGTLRNELWTLQEASWIVAGESAAGPLYREPPADAFFAHTVVLEPLSDADARKLLHAHIPNLREPDVEKVLAAGDGNPRRLLRAAADIQAGISPDEAPTRELVKTATNLAGPLAGRLVEYLSEHGAASASDESMLRQIGASRQRASQLMHQLHSAGLLQTVEQAKEGRPGRPARRFTIKTPT
jgi:energy-coupling factor transporter ATP-binding protein EcfA2